MAKMSFDTYQEAAPVLNQGSGDGIKMFGLKDDGNQAIVRIMHDSTNDFDIGTCHKVKLGDRYRKVACIRDPRDPVDNCPLCKSGAKLESKIYLHMLQYEKTESGQVTVKPVVWERNAKEYGKKLAGMIQEYGPLSDCIFKITRNGKAGDMQTTYELMFANPTVYRPDLYPKDEKAFEGYSAFGRLVLERDFDEISQFLATGQFPQRQTNGATDVNIAGPVNDQPSYGVPVADTTTPSTPPVGSTGQYATYVPQTTTPVTPNTGNPYGIPTGVPTDAPSAAPAARPNRYY